MMPKISMIQSNLGPGIVQSSRDTEETENARNSGNQNHRCIINPPLLQDGRHSNYETQIRNSSLRHSNIKYHHSFSHLRPTRNHSKISIQKKSKQRVLSSNSSHSWSGLNLSELQQDSIYNKKTEVVLSMRQSNVLLSPRVYDSVSSLPLKTKHRVTELNLPNKFQIQQVTVGPIESDSLCDISLAPRSADAGNSTDSLSSFNNCMKSSGITNSRSNDNEIFSEKVKYLSNLKFDESPLLNVFLQPKLPVAHSHYKKKTSNRTSRIHDDVEQPVMLMHKKSSKSSNGNGYSCKPEISRGYLSKPVASEVAGTMDQNYEEKANFAAELHEADFEHLVNQRFLEVLQASEKSFLEEPGRVQTPKNLFANSMTTANEIDLSDFDDNSQKDRRENLSSNFSDSLHVSELDDSVNEFCMIENSSQHKIEEDQLIIDHQSRKRQVHFKVPISASTKISARDILSLKDLGLDPVSESNVGQTKNHAGRVRNYADYDRNSATEKMACAPILSHGSDAAKKQGKNILMPQPSTCNEGKGLNTNASQYEQKEVLDFESQPGTSVARFRHSTCSTKQSHRNSSLIPGSLTTSILVKNGFPTSSKSCLRSHLLPLSCSTDQCDTLREIGMRKIVKRSPPNNQNKIILKARYFRMWQQNVRLLKIVGNKVNLKMVKSVSFYFHTTTMKHFLSWRTLIIRRKMAAEKLHRYHLMKKGFAALLWSVGARKLKQERVYFGKRTLKLKRYMGKWKSRYGDRRFKIIQSTFTQWRLTFRNKVVVDMFGNRRDRLVLLQVFLFWRERFHILTYLRIATEHGHFVVMRKSWQLWRIFTAEKIVQKSQSEVAEIKFETWVLSRCIKRWTKVTIQTQYVRMYRNKKTILNSMNNWRHFTSLAKIYHQKEIALARKLNRKYLLQHHFTSWIHEIRMKMLRDKIIEKITRNCIFIWKAQLQKYRIICSEILSHRNHMLMKTYFFAIREHMKGCKSRRAQALIDFEKFTARRALNSWHHFKIRRVTLRNMQQTFYVSKMKSMTLVSFKIWRFKLQGVLEAQEKQQQWIWYCVRKAANKWIFLLKLAQNKISCKRLMKIFIENSLKDCYRIWKKRCQFENKLYESAKSCKIVLLRNKMRRILRSWNISAQKSINMRPVIEHFNRRKVARYFDAMASFRNRCIFKEEMIVKVKSNCLQQCVGKWMERLDERNNMKLARHEYFLILGKKVFQGWMLYVSHNHDYAVASKECNQSLLRKDFYTWAMSATTRLIQESKEKRESFSRRSNAQYILQSWRSAAKRRFENDEKGITLLRKQHDLAVKRSNFDIWLGNSTKMKTAKKFASRNTEQKLKSMLLSWNFLTTESLMKKMERFTSSIKFLRKQEHQSISKWEQTNHNASDVMIQTDDVIMYDSANILSTIQNIGSQSLSTMSENEFSDASSKELIPAHIDMSQNVPKYVFTNLENFSLSLSSPVPNEVFKDVKRDANYCADSGILIRGYISLTTSEQCNTNSVTSKNTDFRNYSSSKEESVDSNHDGSADQTLSDLTTEHEIFKKVESLYFPLADCHGQSIDAVSNHSSLESSEDNLLTVRDLRITPALSIHKISAGNLTTGKMSISECDEFIKSIQHIESCLPPQSCQERHTQQHHENADNSHFSADCTRKSDFAFRQHEDVSTQKSFKESHLHENTSLDEMNSNKNDCLSQNNSKFDDKSVNAIDDLLESSSDSYSSEKQSGLYKTLIQSVVTFARAEEKQNLFEESILNRANHSCSPEGKTMSKPNRHEKLIEKAEVVKIVCDKNTVENAVIKENFSENQEGESKSSTQYSGISNVATTSTSDGLAFSDQPSSILSDNDVIMRFDDDGIRPGMKEILKERPFLPIHLHFRDHHIPSTEWLVRLAVIRMRYRPLAFAFHQWKLFIHAIKWEKKICCLMDQRNKFLVIKQHFGFWCRNHAQLILSKQHADRALFVDHFQQWLKWMRCQQHIQRMKRSSDQLYSMKLMKITFKNWCQRLERRNALLGILKYWQTKTQRRDSPRSKEGKNQEKFNYNIVLDCFTHWKLQTDQLLMADKHYNQTILLRLLVSWNGWAVRNAGMARKCDKMFFDNLMKRVLKSWLKQVVFMKNVCAMNTHAKRTFLSSLISRWHQYTHVKQTHYSALTRLSCVNRKNSIQACFEKWKREQSKQKWTDIVHRRTLMKKVIGAWHDVTRELIDEKRIVETIVSVVAKHTKQTLLATWRNELIFICKLSAARQQFSDVTVRRTWDVWTEKVSVKRAITCYPMFIKRRMFNAWMKFLKLKLNSDNRARSALLKWHDLTQRNQNLLFMADQFVMRSRIINLEITLSTWLIAFDQSKRAKNHYRNMILGRIFSSLQERAKLRRELLVMKNSFVRQKTNEIFVISWHKWRHQYSTRLQISTVIKNHKMVVECRIIQAHWLRWKHRKLGVDAIQIYNKSLMITGFTRWNVLYGKFKKSNELSKELDERKMKMVITKWWSHTLTSKNERQIISALRESRNRISTMSIFMIWLNSSKNKMIARTYWRKKIEKNAFQCLKNWKNDNKRLKNCYDQAVELIHGLMLKFYFARWMSMFRKVRMLEVTCDEMVEVKSNLTVKIFWRKWFKAKEKVDMQLHYETILALDTINRWESYAKNRVRFRQDCEQRNSMVEIYRIKWVCIRAFSIWKKKYQVQSFLCKNQETLLKRKWDLWKTRTTLFIFAGEMSKNWSMRKHWHSWRLEYVTRQTTEDSTKRINLDLLVSILKIWRAYKYTKKTGRRFSDAIESPMPEEVLTPRKRSRIPVFRKQKSGDY